MYSDVSNGTRPGSKVFSLGSFEFLKGEVTVFLILDLRETYISDLSLLTCLEPFEKFLVDGGWVV